ncbi:hypothetical protein ACF3MZ_16145 [Paenibacillaceae bacterium WGS1546]|uniref:hypothetical protein n=1 Tax=Cohnella sp. WGS1546 TaxID=3366810 RepID=UPI00372D85B1
MRLSWLVLLSSLLTGGSTPSSAPSSMPLPAPPGSEAPPVPATPAVTGAAHWRLEGVSLGDSSAAVKSAWGDPDAVGPDDWLSGCDIWRYAGGRNVSVCDGFVEVVQIGSHAKTIDLSGREIPMDDGSLREALGAPDFSAEDGWGVAVGSEALKVFLDGDGNVSSLDLFSDACQS